MKQLSFLLLFLSAAIQISATPHAYARKTNAAARSTLADMAEENYDIKYLRFNLSVSDTSTFVAGNVITTAQVTAFSMSSYVFELDTLMVIDSAKINGVLRPVTISGNFTRTIVLPLALSSGSMFTAQIFYHGFPPSGSGFFNGLTHSVSAHGTHMIYTVSDPWVAKDWWPAKQSATDKIDSVDLFITVPAGVTDGSNGLLINVDSFSVPGHWTYHWQTHYPIDYYLISIAVARFVEYKSYMHFTGSPDSMLLQNFFTDTSFFNPLYKANFDSINQIVNFYSSLFGRYPFWKEKYGVCFTTLPGGMENQTMTTIGAPDIVTIAHELMHQWFGDHVTYARWGEMWLSEGFATFAEQLFLNHFHGAAAAKTHRQIYLNSALSQPCGQEYVSDTSGPGTLFYQPTVYYKGNGIVTMLRLLAPADSQFFEAMTIYQQRYAFGNATVADMNLIVDSVYGYNVDSFFSQWIYGYGFPKYTVSWNQVGPDVFVKLIQSPSCTAHPTHFNTPVELTFHSAAGDTTVIAYNTLDTQTFSFYWPDSMASLLLNADALTICKQVGAISHDAALGINSPIINMIAAIRPNPTREFWEIDGLPENTQLTLTDMNGKLVWEGKSHHGSTTIPDRILPAGSYLLKAGNLDSVKLEHL